MRHSYGGSGDGGGGGEGPGDLKLRVMFRSGGGKQQKVEAPQVAVPVDAPLAKAVIRMDEAAAAERRRLKQHILARQDDAGGDSGGPRLVRIQQNAPDEQEGKPSGGRRHKK